LEIRKVLRIANSRAIILPKEFPQVRYVVVRLEGKKLIVRPLEEVS